ncbi:DUF2242 domain-containing protein [Ralstonia flaminis]|jgi:hypothetical protein|uniref:DUF2242 domain-containing protein n=1 Tax=Ralstonia flaminis TaxID=3058597 RepID=A0ABM9KDK6_9RALS|nr:DUF2242 domain-containing protein [Ralstonia sp. LMG 18101]CAJ0822239.1 hypothetical protein LMG18101_04906 [Ralstonia sp. LMG 18101]
MPYRFRPLSVLCAATGIAAAVAGCSSAPTPLYQQEQFDAAASPYSRTFHAKADATCEAARRALLSQGYVSTSPRADTIDGSKNFQPSNDSHVVISFHVVCADANADGTSSTAYVNAVQDRYSLKKTSTSASVGLSILGSVSLPIGSGDDSMVKVASETIPAGVFYERYFNLVDHFLKIDPVRRDRAAVKVAEAAAKEHVAPLPEPAPTAQGEPMKMTTPVVPTPPAPPVPAAAPAAAAPAATPAPAPSPASAPAVTPPAPEAKPHVEPAPASAPEATVPAATPAPASAPAANSTGGAS